VATVRRGSLQKDWLSENETRKSSWRVSVRCAKKILKQSSQLDNIPGSALTYSYWATTTFKHLFIFWVRYDFCKLTWSFGETYYCHFSTLTNQKEKGWRAMTNWLACCCQHQGRREPCLAHPSIIKAKVSLNSPIDTDRTNTLGKIWSTANSSDTICYYHVNLRGWIPKFTM